VERGYDLREFILIPFGGAAANHAAAIARDLNMKTVVVPNLCGNLSALGLIVTDVVHDYVRTVGARAAETSPARLLERFREMESEGVAQVLQEHVREEDITLEWSADLRYEGQSWELNTPIKRTPWLGEQEMTDIVNAFHVLHKQAYSYSEASQPVEFINLRVKAIGRNPTVTLSRFEKRPEGFPLPTSKRNVMLEDHGWKHLPVYDRDSLVPGDQFEGPAIVEERLSITFLPPHTAVRVDEFNNLIIDLVEVA
jgi:N-methylhydantoinase A